ncbi:hypothetical protein J6O48_14095 [bacterium]|nr:hypothetical protein [bacterium]
MTIGEKAKAYDEAKARMSRAFNTNRCTIGFMNEIFPELKESEDERIRKDCIKYLDWEYQHCSFNEDKMKIEKCITWLEKQGEQKSTDKTEPKFKIGDWIVNNKDGKFFEVSKVRENSYRIINQEREVFNIHIDVVENDYHKFTVEDAKHGDILTAEVKRSELDYYTDYTSYEEITFVYIKSLEDNDNIHCCCYLDNTTNSLFLSQEKISKCFIRNIKPATKEQYNKLYTKLSTCKFKYDSKNNKLTKLK